MKAELEELAQTAPGAAEREIETEVVYVLKQAGWPRSHINQDVPVSDKGADKADIVLKLDSKPVILVEIKKPGHSRDADNQVNRYCRLLRPSPKLALLTDGVRWVLYYVGKAGAIPIQEASVPSETETVVAILTALAPESLAASIDAGVFQYLDIVEQGLQERSEDAQKHLRPFFASTVKFLLIPSKKPVLDDISGFVMPQNIPLQSTAQSISTRIDPKQIAPQENYEQVEFDPFHPPSLAFTTELTAIFGSVAATKWNALLSVAVKSALDAGHTKQDIQHITKINIQEGRSTDKGFSQIVGTQLSIQGQDANHAWQNTLRLAQTLECEIKAEFRWKDIEKAAYPGKHGIIHWQP
jgi:hypothetical protein